MNNRKVLQIVIFILVSVNAFGQPSSVQRPRREYFSFLDDARLEIGTRLVGVFALDDRAPLSSNPHFKAMLNLIKLGATVESLLEGHQGPMNDIDMDREFGLNGYNKTVLQAYVRYGFGESSDLKIQKHFFEFVISPGYFRQGGKGMHLHVDYQMNLLKTGYGAGANSLDRTFDYEVYTGARLGFDWSSGRSESESGFFSHLDHEISRIANEHDFSAAQLIMLQELANDSKILLPKDVGGSALHAGPMFGARISKSVLKNTRLFLDGSGFYDITDWIGNNGSKENKRSQHHIGLALGLKITIGSEGEMVSFF